MVGVGAQYQVGTSNRDEVQVGDAIEDQCHVQEVLSLIFVCSVCESMTLYLFRY